MPFRAMLVSLAATMLLLPHADANGLQKSLASPGNTCWARAYDAKHIASHPEQKVTAIQLFTEVQDDGTIFASLGFKLKGRTGGGGKYGYNAFAYCKDHGQNLKCVPEWEAGYFTIKQGPRNALTVINSALIVNPSNYDSEDIADNAIDLGDGDDDAWILKSVYPENCEGV